MKRLLTATAAAVALAWLFLPPSFNRAGAGGLDVLPASGQAVAVVTADAGGDWAVFGPDGLDAVKPRIVEAGRVCIFVGPPGRYLVLFDTPTGPPTVARVTLGPGGDPQPQPEPDPDDPDPIDPDDVWRKWAADTAREKVTDAGLARAAALAAAIDKAAGEMGELTPRAARELLKRNVAPALADDAAAWAEFDESLDFQLSNMAARRKLTTAAEYAEILQAIAAGLRDVAP